MTDARLLVPAVALWAGVALTLTWGPALGAVPVVAAALLSVILVGVRRHAVLVGVVFATLGVAVALALPWRLTPEPVAGWIEDRATVVAAVTVTGEARPRRPTTSGAGWAVADQSVRATASVLAARGQTVEVHLPIIIRMAQDASVPARGSRIEVTGRLSPMPVTSGLAAQIRVRDDGWRLLSEPGPIPTTATAMRQGLAVSLSDAAPPAASVVRGLTLGDDADMPADLTEAMRASGLAHLMAVSGGNVAIIVGLVVGLAVVLGAPLWARVLAGGIAVVFYAYLVGQEPSVLRASVMGVITLLSVIVGGRRAGPSILGVSVIGLIMAMPWLALSWGFALSCAATAGILLLAPRIMDGLSRALPRCPTLVIQATSLTVAAQVATLPLLVAMGGASGWVAVPANLAAMPMVAPVTVLGLLAAVLSPVAPAVAHLLATVASWPAGAIAWIATVSPALPLADWPVGADWPSGGAGVVLVVVVGAGALAGWRLWRSAWWTRTPPGVRWSALALVTVLAVVVVGRPPGQRGWPPPDWIVLMCDVGQGDGLLLNAGDGAAVVVDAGSDPDAIDGCLTTAGISRVPAIVLTHFHADHVGGLGGVTRGRSVGAVLSSPLLEPRDQSSLVQEAVDRAGLTLELITAGDTRRVGDVVWRALWPRRVIRSGSLPNNASVVLQAQVRGFTILLTGDVEPEAQRALLDDVRGIAPDVVKVPHHGSRHQLREFADLVRAPIALVSVGADNEYGHPDVEASSWFAAPRGRLLRTDEDGEVAVVVVPPEPSPDEAAMGSSGTRLGTVVRDGMLPSS